MPRDLSDLMESAVSSAPPEKYLAGDITRVAERAQRRRTTFIAAGAAATVVAVAGVTVGLTQHHPSRPEPAHAPYLYDQTVDASQAVPASSLPGYELEPWTIPSVQPMGRGLGPNPVYREVDTQGRLITVEFVRSGQRGGEDVSLYDAPGQAPRPLVVPPSPGVNGTSRISWIPSFYGNGRLIWSPSAPIVSSAKEGFHLTDLSGGHDQFVHSSFTVGQESFDASADDATDGSMWATVYKAADLKTGTTTFDLYRGTFSGDVEKLADDVSVLDVGDGIAGWVTTDGQVFVQDPSGPPRHVHVPLDPGCQVSPAGWFQAVDAFAVSPSAIAVTERCGKGKGQVDELLAFDLSGRALVRVTTKGAAFKLTFAGDALIFGSLAGPDAKNAILRYDLATGGLSSLSTQPGTRPLQDPQGAGDYVLWYDNTGGHVAHIPD